MIRYRNLVTSVFTLVAALLLAGCAQSNPAPSPTPEPPTASPEPSDTATVLPTDTPPSPTPIPPTATSEPTETTTSIPITAEDLLGLWFAADHAIPHYMQIGEDGYNRVAGTLAEVESGTFFAVDEFTLEGDIISFFGIGSICRRQSGQYQVTMPESGKLQFKIINDDCPDRINGVNGTLYTLMEE